MGRNVQSVEQLQRAFCQNLRQRREEVGMTQQQLARTAGLSYNFVSQVERGVKQPTLGTIAKLAKALEMPPHLLLFEKAKPPDQQEEKVVQLLRRLKRKDLPLVQRIIRALAEHL